MFHKYTLFWWCSGLPVSEIKGNNAFKSKLFYSTLFVMMVARPMYWQLVLSLQNQAHHSYENQHELTDPWFRRNWAWPKRNQAGENYEC